MNVSIAYHAPSHPGLGYPGFVDPKPHRPSPSPFPRLDDRLVRPETREERVRGRAVVAMPASPPHAERHYELDFVTRGALARGYVGASDLLTRSGPGSDFATDTCIRREGIDPETGERYLEELAFEVVGEQSLRDITERAADLTARGVRRVIAIFAKSGEVREWSRELDDWRVLDPDDVLEDRTLAQPIPIRALLDRAEANRTVVLALYAQQEPEIMAIEAKGITQGIVALCTVLDIPLDADRRATLQALDVPGLQALLATLGHERRWPDG